MYPVIFIGFQYYRRILQTNKLRVILLVARFLADFIFEARLGIYQTPYNGEKKVS